MTTVLATSNVAPYLKEQETKQPLRKATYIKIKDLASIYNIDIATLPKLYKETLKLKSNDVGGKNDKVDPCEIGANARPRGVKNVGGDSTSVSGGSSNSPISKSVHSQKSLSCGYNLCVLVGEINMVVDKFRVDQSRVRLAEVEVGDETGTISLRARDDQIDTLQKVLSSKNKKNTPNNSGAVVLRNCTIELYQNKHLRLAITKWGKLSYYPDNVDSTPNPPLSMNKEKNISLADVSAFISSMDNVARVGDQVRGNENILLDDSLSTSVASSSAPQPQKHYRNKHNITYSTIHQNQQYNYQSSLQHQDRMQQQSAFHYPNTYMMQSQQQTKQRSRYPSQQQHNYYRNTNNRHGNQYNASRRHNNQQRLSWQQYHRSQQQQLQLLYYQQEQQMLAQQRQNSRMQQHQQIFPIIPGLVRSVSIDSSCSNDIPPHLFIPLEQTTQNQQQSSSSTSPTNIYNTSSYTPSSPNTNQSYNPYVIQEEAYYSPSPDKTQWQNDQHYFNIDSTPSTPNLQSNNAQQQQISFIPSLTPQTQLSAGVFPYYSFSPNTTIYETSPTPPPLPHQQYYVGSAQQQFYIPQQQFVQRDKTHEDDDKNDEKK